ncbi:hypothetical protein NDN08_005051 [Rhodosorus marinus]|uniref:Anaphase-promoting complex subunit 4 WD40 domain-containing protein n=1 Tax=Rhodosorus marinus TaxID=101924 RepID=A0AAV8V357_9RHOD|nr:hypothetical protein NDN08_005051 [Rhodosorus marinus]
MSSNGVGSARVARSSFVVPGEGSYVLLSELQPTSAPSTTSGSSAGRNPASSSQSSSIGSGHYGGPLGLSNATLLGITSEHSDTSDGGPEGRNLTASSSNTSDRSGKGKQQLVKKLGLGGLQRFGGQSTSDTSASSKASKNAAIDSALSEIEKQSPRARDVQYYVAFNSMDVLCTSNSKDDEPVQSVKFRSTVTALEGSNNNKLLVGCANGEIYYYTDTAMLVAKGSNSVPLAALTLIGGGVTSSLYNKDGNLNSSRITGLKWMPGSLSKFLAVHLDGGLFVYDVRQKAAGSSKSSGSRGEGMDDWKSSMNPNSGQPGSTSASNAVGSGAQSVSGSGPLNGSGSSGAKTNGMNGGTATGGNSSESAIRGSSHKRITAPAFQLGVHQIATFHPPRGRRSNPMMQMQIGKGGINAAAFAPDGTVSSNQVALACRDGYLRVIDFAKEHLLLCLKSYYGAILCVAWSHDGKYIATGGEDDLVTVWCPGEASIIARLEGHSSWVSSVAWDEASFSSGRYRLGSVGQDAKLALWDFAVDSLHLRSHRVSKTRSGPATKSSTASSARLLGSKISRGFRSTTGVGITSRVSGESSESTIPIPYIQKEALGRAEVPVLEPLVDHPAHNEPVTDIAFTSDAIITACAGGVARIWAKPPVASRIPFASTTGSTASESNSGGDLESLGAAMNRAELD